MPTSLLQTIYVGMYCLHPNYCWVLFICLTQVASGSKTVLAVGPGMLSQLSLT